MLFEAQLSVMLFFNCYYYFFRPPLEFFWPMRALSLAFLRLVHISTSINISANQHTSKSAFICRKSEFWRRKRKRRKKQDMDRKMTESVSILYLNWFILCSTINLNVFLCLFVGICWIFEARKGESKKRSLHFCYIRCWKCKRQYSNALFSYCLVADISFYACL